MNYDNEKLNEVILVLWNDIKGELIPEHEKLTKFAYAINAWTNNQNENVDDCKFEVKTIIPEMYDMNGIKIIPGHKIVYQKGKIYECRCDIIERNGKVLFANWEDGEKNMLASDFWYQEMDGKITEVLNHEYKG